MKRLLLVFCLIIAQAALTLAVAYASLYAQRGGAPSTILTYDGAEYSGAMDELSIEADLYEKIAAQIETRSARIHFGQDEFVFGLPEINLALDLAALRNDIKANFQKYYASSLLSAFRNPYYVELVPAYHLDSDKLREKLLLIQEFIGREPVDAGIDLVDGEIIKTDSADGLLFDVDASLPKMLAAFESQPFRRYTLAGPDAAPNSREIRRQMPYVRSDAFNGIDGVIAEASTPIIDESDNDLFTDAAYRIDKVLLFADDTHVNTQLPAGLFSLRKYLGNIPASGAEGGDSIQIPDYVGSQVATTLYIAALEAGIETDKFTVVNAKTERIQGKIYRTPIIADLAYCERGFGTAYENDGADFQFENSLESNIILFASVEDGQFTIRIAGHVGDADGAGAQRELRTETESTGSADVVSVYRDGELIDEVEYPKASS